MSWPGVLLFLPGWACGWVLCWRRLPLVVPPGAPRPAVAVVIPARNEAATLPELLASLASQVRPGDQVLVVDDASTDGTSAVAAEAGARVVAAAPLPPGWTGKSWACHTGVGATSAPILVFLDADVVLAPRALDRLAGAAAARPDTLVSVQPWHRMVRPCEQLSAPFNLVALAGTGLTTPWGARVPVRLAFGPVLASTRSAYDGVGGHAHVSVRGCVVDDIALACRYHGRVQLAQARDVATFRMYPDGLHRLVEGWTKNIAAGAAAVPGWALALTVAWLWSMIGSPAAGWPCWLASAAQVWVLGRRVGSVRWWAALLAPLLAVWFVVVLGRSAWRRLRRRPVRWRGRDVAPR